MNDAEPVEQVLAKLPFFAQSAQVAVGGRHDARIDGDRFVGSDSLNLVRLQHAQATSPALTTAARRFRRGRWCRCARFRICPCGRDDAPVNAPLRCPNSSDSSRFSGIAPQLTEMNGRSARTPLAWITFAISSLPVPLSPSMSTGRSVGAAFSAISSASSSLGLSPNAPSKTKLRSSRALATLLAAIDPARAGSAAAAVTNRSLCDSCITSSRSAFDCRSSFSMSGRSRLDVQRSVERRISIFSISPAYEIAELASGSGRGFSCARSTASAPAGSTCRCCSTSSSCRPCSTIAPS